MIKEDSEVSAQPVTGNTSVTAPENRAFFPALDGLRALAFVMVFLDHYLTMPWGWAGVDIFFVLSGFLITGILFDSRDQPHRVRNFYLRRTLRIFPLYYGVLLFILLLRPIVHWDLSWAWLLWPAYLGNYASLLAPHSPGPAFERLVDFQPLGFLGHRQVLLYLGHFWSLCVEEQFYLVWPWLVFYAKGRRPLMWICALALPACLTLRLLAQQYLPSRMLDRLVLYRFTPFRLDALLIGGLLALWLRGDNSMIFLRTARFILPIAMGVIVLWFIATPARHVLQQPYSDPLWVYTWGLTGVDIFAALLVAVAIQPDSWVYRILSLPPLRWLGRVSYGAYVFHDIPRLRYLGLATKLLPTHPANWRGLTAIIGFVCTIALSALSFRYFETPFLNLKERWTIRAAARSLTKADVHASVSLGAPEEFAIIRAKKGQPNGAANTKNFGRQ
jgi:peptidoglycan/LPS O-acetylase OafA/YrhL